MWIIPKTYPLYSAFAAAMVASSEDLSLPDLNIEQSLMWRSKPSQLKTWQRRWKTVCWMPRLCGRILKPSRQKSFETKLTLLLEAIHANRSRQQANAKVKTTPDTCGHLSETTLEQLDLLDACLKTSRATYRLDSPQSSAIWKKMVTQRRGEYSQRKKLAHRTDGSGCLSWPTPRAQEPGRTTEGYGKGLEETVLGKQQIKKTWPTPNTLDYISVVRKPEERSEKAKKGGCSNLREQVHWATPNTMDYLPQRDEEAMKRMIRNGQRKNRVRPSNLREQVSPEMVEAVNQARAEANNCTIEELDPPAIPIPQKWPTPNTSDAKSANMKPNKDGIPHDIEKNYLRGTVQSWPTPRTADAEGGPELAVKTDSGFRIYRHSGKWFGAKLRDAVNTWPTPSARDHKGGSGTIVEEDGKFYRVSDTTQTRFGARLDAVVEHLEKWPTPRASEYKDCGPVGSKSHRHMDKKSYLCAKAKNAEKPTAHLNPDWVEQLMGVPLGWTALDGTSNEWEYGWHDGSWEAGIPRVVERCDDRVDRIRLLGNGVVPATAAKAWIILGERL